MDNYEVNVLTRKGGWKKLPQEVIHNSNESKLNNSDNLNINVNEETFDNDTLENFNNNLFETCSEFLAKCKSNIVPNITGIKNKHGLILHLLFFLRLLFLGALYVAIDGDVCIG